MIKRIFIDNDECLSHACRKDPEQESIVVTSYGEFYHTIVRPSAVKLIEFARELVGVNNVYMLTSATREYASQVCEKAGFGFDKDRLHTRENMEKYEYYGAYGSIGCLPNPDLADKNNILIDNLPSGYNTLKMSYIGINSSRYLQVSDYYGANHRENEFFDMVTQFLLTKHNEE